MAAAARALAVALGCWSAAIAADTISIRADEWLPYNGPTTRRPAGYMIEMADRIAAAAGHSIDYRHLPWEDSLEAVAQGQFDCVVGAAAEEVEGFARPALSWGVSQNAAYTLADAPHQVSDAESLKQLRLVVIPGYSYGDELDGWIEQNASDSNRVVTVSSGGRAAMTAVSKLVAKQADVFVEDRNVMAHTLKLLGMQQRLRERAPIGAADPVYIACTAANPRGAAWAQLFEDGTRQLRASGELAVLLANYGLQDWLTAEPE